MIPDMEIEIAGAALVLLPERAAFLPDAETLLVADVHFGKAAAFRAAHIPLPGGNTEDEIARLTSAVKRTGARRIIFLGDLLHTKRGRDAQTLALVRAWRREHSDLDMVLVRGNHDTHASDPPEDWAISCVEAPYPLAPFLLQHLPVPHADGYVLAGHLHPAARLIGAGQQLKLPCFWFGQQVGVLPAFGSFTDMAIIKPHPGNRVYVIAEDELIAV